MFQEHEWDHKPSITSLKAAVKKSIAAGYTTIHLTWGENQIRLEKQTRWIGNNGPWDGEGWISKKGGADLAKQLNEEIRNAHD